MRIQSLFALLFTVSFLATPALSQHDLNSTFLRESWVSTFNNPAWVPNKKLHIGLPTFYFNASVNAPNLKSIVDLNDWNVDIDWTELVDKVGEDIRLGWDAEIHPLYFSMGLGNFRFGLEYSVQHKTSFRIGGDLVRFLANGNMPYANEALDFAPSIYSVSYHSIALPFSVEKDKWTFGIRPALVKGIAAMHTPTSQLNLTTDTNTGEMTLAGEIAVEGSATLIPDMNTDLGIDFNGNFLQNGFRLQNNTGFSLDLGTRYRATENLTLGASITGLGLINWDKEVLSYTAEGASSLTGLEFEGFAQGDTLNLGDQVEVWVENFESETKESASFTTPLAKNIYLTGQYQINGLFEVGAILYGELLNGQFDPAFALNGRVHAGKILAFGLTYGMRQKKWTHIGANLLVKAGPVQFFLASDNVLTAFNPTGNSSTNFRVGLALAFGKDAL